MRFVFELGERRVALHPGTWRIGRDPSCEICLTDDSVSRRHATLRVKEELVELEDHGSRNGVKVNGKRVYGRRELAIGDELQVGSERLRLGEIAPGPVVGAPTRPLPLVVPKEQEDKLEALSPREREVLEGIALGETQREIAERLGLSVKTVETYRARIRDKLNAQSRADLIRFALEAGLLKVRGS